MNKKNIEDFIKYDFHTPNTKEVREYLEKNFDITKSHKGWLSTDKYITIQTQCGYVFTCIFTCGKFIPTSEFKKLIGMEENMTTFTKAQLKTGMILVFKNGDKAMVLLDTNNGDIVSGDTWFPLISYSDEDLFLERNGSLENGGVVKIYQPNNNRFFNMSRFDKYIGDYTLIWERKEKTPTQIRLEELEQQQRFIADQIAAISQTM